MTFNNSSDIFDCKTHLFFLQKIVPPDSVLIPTAGSLVVSYFIYCLSLPNKYL